MIFNEYSLEERARAIEAPDSSATTTSVVDLKGASRRDSSYTSGNSDGSEGTYAGRFSLSPTSGSYSISSLAQSDESAEKYAHVHQANGGCQCGH